MVFVSRKNGVLGKRCYYRSPDKIPEEAVSCIRLYAVYLRFSVNVSDFSVDRYVVKLGKLLYFRIYRSVH